MDCNTVILEERDDLLIIQDSNGVTTIPKTAYHVLRIRHYSGNRIFYDFGVGAVKETYDDGVFNCWLHGRQIQIADGDGIARAIQSGGSEQYADLFEKWYDAKMQAEVIDIVARSFPGRVNHVGDGYEIDDLFRVDSHGVSWRRDGSAWLHLCLVARTDGAQNRIGLADGTNVKINAVTMTIIAKMMFLLNPDPKDGVFMGQLDGMCAKHVIHLAREAPASRDA